MRISYDLFTIEMVSTLVNDIEKVYLEENAAIFRPDVSNWNREGYDRRLINGRIIVDTNTMYVTGRVQENEITSR